MNENNDKKDINEITNNPAINSSLNEEKNINNSKKQNNNIEMIKTEINEIFIEQQLIKKKNFIQKKDFFELELTILKEMIQTEKDISLLIIIPFKYPKYEPEIYCLTEFCTPHLCDGRNLLYDIIKKPWQRQVHTIDFVVNKLPGFFLTFNEFRIKNKNLIVGKFILNKYYLINRLKELPIYFHLITHKEKKSPFKTIKSHKIITISEISFCMFELDNSHTGYCKLIFWADLKDLISTKLDSKKNEIETKWKNPENDKKSIKIEIISPNSENINNILMENQKNFLKLNEVHNNKKENKEDNINENEEHKDNKDIKNDNDIKDRNIKNNRNKDNIKDNEIKSDENKLDKEEKSDNINNLDKKENIQNIDKKENIKLYKDKDTNKENDNLKKEENIIYQNTNKSINNEENKNSQKDNSNKDNIKNNPAPINIAMVEKQIIYVEKSLNIGDKPNNEQLNYLMKLYQNALTYYSTINNEKQNIFKTKIDKLQQIINKIEANKLKKDNIKEEKKLFNKKENKKE